MKNKFVYIDYIRVFATLSLVLYHCLCYYTRRWPYKEILIPEFEYICGRIVNISLPLFVFISGYLYSKLNSEGAYQDILQFVKKKTIRLLFPWLVWSSLFYIIYYHDFPVFRFYTGGTTIFGFC